MIIDADAHVVETAHTWDYLDSTEKNIVSSFLNQPTTQTPNTGFSTVETSVSAMRR